MPDDKAETSLRAILAISQVEVSVKKFWSKIGDYLPKPEIEEVAATFAESEVRHAQAYSNLLDIMELNNRFASLTDVPAMRGRINYLRDANTKVLENRDVFKNIILFSMFIENVSLFSQFYVLLKFNKEEKWLNGTANAILATSKEEVIHANFGFDLINTIKKENGQWWTDELKQEIYDAADTALAAEGKVIEWICNGDEDLENEVYNFVCLRMDDSLKAIGLNPQYYKLDDKKEFEWFYTLTESRAAIDFFNSKDPSYTKGDKAVTADDLF
jgi:ribonucleoside-diphosphate reductase beta chain